MNSIFVNTLGYLLLLIAPFEGLFDSKNKKIPLENYVYKEINLPFKSDLSFFKPENPFRDDELNKLGALLWRATFETGDKSEFKPGGEFITGPGKASSIVTNEQSKSGSRSLKMTVNSTDGKAGTRHLRWEDPDDNKDLIYTTWFYIPEKIDYSGNFFSNIMQWKLRNVKGSSRVLWELGFGVRGGRGSKGENFITLRRNLEHWGGTSGSNINYNAIKDINVPVGKWFKLQVRYIHGHNNNGRIMIWQGDTNGNDVLIYDIKNVTTYPLVNGDGVKSDKLRWSVNNYTMNTLPKTTHIFIDDVSFHLPAENNDSNTNASPSVSITAPGSNAQFAQGDNIRITGNASDSDGTIAKVEFYNGNTLLGTDTTSPYSFVWSNVSVGSFALTTKATDNKGAVTVSDPVAINVVDKNNESSTPEAGTGLLEGLVAFYEMNTNFSGALNDSHGENHGISTRISHVNGFNEKGNKYDGSSSISSVPNSNSLNLTTEFTLMADIFREGNGQASTSIIIGKTFSSSWPENQTYSMGLTRDNKIRIRANVSGLKDWVSTKTVPMGKWVRVIASYKSGEGFSLYLDSVNPEKSSQIAGSITKSNLELTIGSASLINNAANNRRVEGILDNVGIWNRQLSKAEIGELITTRITYPDFGKVQESNGAPSVSISGPSSNSQFTKGEKITITAEASDKDAKITKVEFYNGDTRLGTDTTSPYSFTWTNAPVGNFILTAVSTNDKEWVTVSEIVEIEVQEEDNVSNKPSEESGLLEGLVAFYEMNTNLSGALKDSHGENHGTSKQINHVNGFNEKGYKYDGSSSISSVPHSNSLNLTTEFTLMADIYREGNGQESTSIIIGKTFSTSWPENQTYSMGLTRDNKIRIRANVSGLKDWVSTKTVPMGKWVRVIASYKSGEGYSLYLDTVNPEKSSQISGSISKSDLELTIGSASLINNAANARRVEGILDNVGIWNRQLSKTEIGELITKRITYPDFKSKESYRISIVKTTEEISGNVSVSSGSTKAEAGEKLIFLVNEEENLVFDHWSMDDVRISNQTLFELDMPEKDITLTKHFRRFVAPEIKVILPGQQDEFEAFSEIHIELETKSNDAKIEKIELFNREDLIGQLSQDSLAFSWKNIPKGKHQLVGRITDTNGKSYFSEPVVLNSVEYQPKEIPNVLLEYAIGPNPTTDYLNVIFKNLDGIYDFEFSIVSMNGVVEKTFNLSPKESTVTIDVSDLNKGVYVLHLIGNDHNLSSMKFIKQ